MSSWSDNFLRMPEGSFRISIYKYGILNKFKYIHYYRIWRGTLNELPEQNQRMVSAELPIDYYTFQIFNFSRRTVRDKALLALTTSQKTRCLPQTYIRFHCQLLVRVRVALKSDYDPISTRSPAAI